MKTKKKAKKKVAKKKQTVTIKQKIEKGSAFFVASEMADDAQVEREVLGQTSKTTVYQFVSDDGDVIMGLSIIGVREAVRIINGTPKYGHKIRVAPNPAPRVERNTTQNGQEGVEVWVYAEDTVAGSGQWGIKFEPWQKSVLVDGRGTLVHNRFALETALSKAQRNAMFSLLPSNLVESMITKFAKNKGAVETIIAPDVEMHTYVPEAADEGKMYAGTIARLNRVKGDRKKLSEALEKVPNMLLSDDQKKEVEKVIRGYLKNLK